MVRLRQGDDIADVEVCRQLTYDGLQPFRNQKYTDLKLRNKLFVIVAIFEENPFLPPSLPTPVFEGVLLPDMPKEPVRKAAYQYGPNVLFRLKRHSRSSQSEKELTIEIVRPLHLGYGDRTQVVLAQVTGGPKALTGKAFVFRIYDPVYISPSDVWIFPYNGISFTLFSVNHIDRPSSSSSSSSSSGSKKSDLSEKTLRPPAKTSKASSSFNQLGRAIRR
jgi:hypothetical protein